MLQVCNSTCILAAFLKIWIFRFKPESKWDEHFPAEPDEVPGLIQDNPPLESMSRLSGSSGVGNNFLSKSRCRSQRLFYFMH